MTELNREEINEVLSAMQTLFMEKKYSNVAILNALSSMSVHLAFVFGIPKDTYLKDMGIMFEERVERAIEESKNASH